MTITPEELKRLCTQRRLEQAVADTYQYKEMADVNFRKALEALALHLGKVVYGEAIVDKQVEEK